MPERRYGDLPWQGIEDWLQQFWLGRKSGPLWQQYYETPWWQRPFTAFGTAYPRGMTAELGPGFYEAQERQRARATTTTQPKPEEEAELDHFEVITRGGFSFLIGIDKDGNEIPGTEQSLGRTPEAKQTYGADWASQQAQKYQQRLSEQQRGQAEEMSRLWEMMQLRQMAGLDPYRDWIQRHKVAWQLAQGAPGRPEKKERTYPGVFDAYRRAITEGPSRYGPSGQLGEGWAGDVARAEMFGEDIGQMKEKMAQYGVPKVGDFPGAGKGGFEQPTPSGEPRWVGREEDVIGAQKKASRKKRDRKEKPRWIPPPTPGWLAGLYPQLTAGAPLSKVPMAPLSGQAWTRLPESQKQQWMSFAEYSGGIPMDLLSQMQMMLPRAPTRTRGWRPARQRTGI